MDESTDNANLCPDCGAVIKSMDEPCPNCASDEPEVVPYQFFKSFKNRTSVRYRPDAFLDTLNEWLKSEQGLFDVGYAIHRSQGALVSGVTFTCNGVNVPSGRLFQMERIILAKGTFSRQHRLLGDALNDWKDRNPGRKLLRFTGLSVAGVDIEVWILYVQVAPAEAPSRLAADVQD